MFLGNYKRILKATFILIAIFSAYRAFAFFSQDEKALAFEGASKAVAVEDNGVNFNLETRADTVGGFLEEKKIELKEHDELFPSRESRIYPGASIRIRRSVDIIIAVDGKEIDNYFIGKTVKEALAQNGVILGRLDKTEPSLGSAVENNAEIVVTRINIEDIVKKEGIDFKTIAKTNSKMGWQEKKIEVNGVKGEKEVKYRVTYKNGKEISRVKLETNILSEPVDQIETQGTYMKLGGVNKGQGTWYAYKGGMFAASTTIPKGAYAKVTNTANGKSVIVQINDYGPQGKGRVIDLDKVAFAKIASLGAGVIGVKVEQVLN